MSDSQPRIAPVPLADRTDEQRALLTAVLGDRAPNLFTTVVRHPTLYRTWLPFCMELLTNSVFPPRERELLIIRTAWLCGSTYELGHHRRLGTDEGLTEDDLAAVTGEPSPAWTPRERLLIAAVDELHANHTILDATWHELSAQLTTEQLIELPMLVGHYILLAGTLSSLGVQLDSDRPGLTALSETAR
ncbi:MAG TPA: carboxymuconolactone decarboxylase family protein [Pseudonocardiaceae bacterium]|jgi:alkylhydroperoxidase family enzyme|nr:carboxymuconolactone decarboxylase family protein [Pseudonocardiaceae bacterium]